MEYEKVYLKMDYGHHYSYFQEDVDERLPEPLSDELYMNVFVDADHGHDKVTGGSITGIISVVGSNPTTLS